MKNRLFAPAIAMGLLAAGCSTTSSESMPTPLFTPVIDMSCNPKLDMDWGVLAPADVVAERKLPWEVTTSEIGDLALTYYRDCGVEVRGPETVAYPNGPLLASSFCEGDSVGLMVDDFEANNAFAPADKQISPELIAAVKDLEPILKQSTACHTGQVALIASER